MTKKDAVLVQSRIGLAPAVLVDNISQGATANGAETPQRVADGEYSVGVDTRRQAENGLDFLFVIQVPGVAPLPG